MQKLIVISLVAAAILNSKTNAVPVTGPELKPPSIDFKQGFEYCCPKTQKELQLPEQWTRDCLKEYDNFQKGYDQTSAKYYSDALLGLGMKDATYINSVFWSSNKVADIFNIMLQISPSSPPSSLNIPAGVFGNCINEQYPSADIITYWFEFSRLMAMKSANYVFWLTTGDVTTNYFPNTTPPSIFQTYELPNLIPPRVPGLTVLNARSPSSKGLTCAQDTKSRDKLVSVNNKLAYYCCDISLTSNSTLDFINKVIKGIMQTGNFGDLLGDLKLNSIVHVAHVGNVTTKIN